MAKRQRNKGRHGTLSTSGAPSKTATRPVEAVSGDPAEEPITPDPPRKNLPLLLLSILLLVAWLAILTWLAVTA
jgi:hypothetical protein